MASDALEIVAGSSLVIAVGLAMMGYWPMPFAGMEILLLAWALYYAALPSAMAHGDQREY